MKPLHRIKNKTKINQAGQPVMKTAKDKQGAASDVKETPEKDTKSKKTKEPAPIRKECPKPAAVPKKGDAHDSFFLKVVEDHLPCLLELFGRTAAYEVLARASHVLDKFARGKVSLPGSVCGMISLAMTLTGLSDTDAMQAKYEKHLVSSKRITLTKHRESVCMWAMCLPFDRDLPA